jgi:4-aminobutyrate aminotransferase-like enzyme
MTAASREARATGGALPSLQTAVPGPRSMGWVDRLAARECPAITARRARRAAALGAAADDPIVWAEAHGANVIDVDDNVFVDMTAGFGVASVGHGHPAVVAAMQAQAGRLLHAMGDAFPDPQRILLMERLTALSGYDRVIFGSSGSDAVEAALKTARVATGRDGVLSFEGAYHGLSYGALVADGYKINDFREPFAGQLGPHVRRAPFGGPLPSLEGLGAVLVEPIQGRGGVRSPPEGWLDALIEAAHKAGAVVIFDEIYTGMGRTGRWLRAHGLQRRPDLVCLGKGLAGGYPISACLGTAAVMDAWGASRGEALHTQTFLGNPVGSAMALACIDVLEGVLPTIQAKGAALRAQLEAEGYGVQGEGLLLGVRLPDTLRASRALLDRGFIVLPAGEQAEVLALTPPLTITEAQLQAFVAALCAVAPARGAEPGVDLGR